MVSKFRTKVASIVSKIDDADDFNFTNWLRAPKVRFKDKEVILDSAETINIYIEKFEVYFFEDFPLHFPNPKVSKLKQIIHINKEPKVFLVFFDLGRPKLFSLRKNLFSKPAVINYNSSLPQIPEVIDQSIAYIAKAPNIFSFAFFYPNVRTNKIPLLMNLPETKDLLSNLSTEIFNFELLHKNKLVDQNISSSKFDIEDFVLPELIKIVVPGIDDLLKSVTVSKTIPIEDINLTEVKMFDPVFTCTTSIAKLKIPSTKTVIKKVVFKHENLESKVFNALDNKSYNQNSINKIKSILSAFSQMSWAEYLKSLKNLTNEESDSADCLVKNNNVILGNELGFDRIAQIIAALDYLVKSGKIKSILLIGDSPRFVNLWQSQIEKYINDLYIRQYTRTEFTSNEEGSVLWFLNRNQMTDIDSIILSEMDLVIVDECFNFNSFIKPLDVILNKVVAKYLWILTGEINETNIKSNLEELSFVKNKDVKISVKSLDNTSQEGSMLIKRDIWLELDDQQKKEYSDAMVQAADEIKKLIENFNPFLLQSNIFKILHKLNQILNFATTSSYSPKMNLLVDRVKTIARNEKKVLVFTQYEVNGIKKIEKAFEQNGISYFVGKNGMTVEEIKQSMDTFSNSKNVAVFLTNLKPSRLEIDIRKVEYIIIFDEWWNPVNTWQTYDELGLNNKLESPVVVYNYKIKNTFEERLYELLNIKCLTQKNIFESLKSEDISELMLIDDWMYIFGLNNNYLTKIKSDKEIIYNRIQKNDLRAFKNLLKTVFILLGYDQVSTMDIENEPMFYFSSKFYKGNKAISLYGKFIFKKLVEANDYMDVINSVTKEGDLRNKVIVTNGDFKEKVAGDVFFLNCHELANIILTIGMKI